MNRPSLTVRLIAATGAVATTVVLFGAVVANAEPERSVLIARHQRIEKLPAAPAAVVLAANHAARAGK